jgi:glycosyltransferase involved in cell wall biosynthesis
MSDPRISIIIPCHDDGRFLAETLASAFAQEGADIEVIIVDDYSTDPATRAVLDRLDTGPRLRLIRLPQRAGPAAARNVAIDHANGKYILPLDADDHILPGYAAKASAMLDGDNSLQIVYCRAELFGIERGPWKLPPFDANRFVLANPIFATAMFRRDFWKRVGGYSENMTHGMEDYDFWMKILAAGGGVHQIDEVLFRYRIKAHSRTANLAKNDFLLERATYDLLLDNNMDFFRRPANVKTVFYEYLRQAHYVNRIHSSLLWRALFRHLVSLEVGVRRQIRRLLGRA